MFISPNPVSQLFLERERAAILAEAKTDDLISEAPKPALDQSGEWQETSGEIQWVAAETNDSQTDKTESEKKEEEDEELDLNKGSVRLCLCPLAKTRISKDANINEEVVMTAQQQIHRLSCFFLTSGLQSIYPLEFV